jgi:hypothetical protein
MTTNPEMFSNRERPMSKNELEDLRKIITKKLFLSDMYITHKCGHKYRVKKNGKKHKMLLSLAETGDEHKEFEKDTCSVCWKLQKDRDAIYLVHNFVRIFTPDPNLRYEDFLAEYDFYEWLYSPI